nr:S8 family serine peptidase [Lachnospiraceae bacterium]
MKKRMKMLLAVLLSFAMVMGTGGSSIYAMDGGQTVLTELDEADVLAGNESSDPTETVTSAEPAEDVQGSAEPEPAETTDAAGTTDTTDADGSQLPEGINGMPEDYQLTELELRIKAGVQENNAVEEVNAGTPGVDYVENEVICIADSRAHAQMIAEAYGGELIRYSFMVATISLAGSELTVPEAVSAGADPDINIPAVEPNYIIPVEEPVVSEDEDSLMGDVPQMTTWFDITDPDGYDFNDPALKPTDPNYQWMHDMINSYGAWGVTIGSENIRVAVIDTGVYADHEDLAGKVTLENIGWGTDDQNGHGTHVAGIIGAIAGNGLGGAGVAPGVSILGIRASDENDLFDDGDIARAIYLVSGYELTGAGDDAHYERNNDPIADIINMSLGGPGYTEVVREAINAAYESGVTICAAMGNEHSNLRSYPACYDHVISVSAVYPAGYKTAFSNFGGWADIAAPGAAIYSTIPGEDKYDSWNGTSMACPVVAGACALYMSAMGHVDPDTMERVLKSSINKAGSAQIGEGILDVSKMFSGDVTPPVISLYAPTGVDEETVEIAVSRDGKVVTVGPTVPSDAVISLDRADFNGDGTYQGEADTGNQYREILIYTTDGQNPKVENGDVITGEIYTPEDPLAVADLLAGETTDKRITVKAACVTGMGVISKISTMIFTADPSATYGESGIKSSEEVEIIGAPPFILAGGTVTLTARVLPEDFDQNVFWRISSYKDGDLSKASIGETTGRIKTDPGQSGTLVIECAASDGNKYDTVEIRVVKELSTVGTITLDKNAAELCFGCEDDLNIQDEKNITEVSIATLLDSSKEHTDMLAELPGGGCLADNIGFRWTSSNPKVATVTVVGDTHSRTAKITAAGKGSTMITCTAQDGSGKSAACRVTVVQDVEQIEITGQGYIEPGAKAAYKAVITPATANKKTVEWSIEYAEGGPAPENVTINAKTGRVSVGADAEPYAA